MIRFFLLLLLFYLALGCERSTPAIDPEPERHASATTTALPGADDRTYVPGERFGAIGADATAEDVVTLYGTENFVSATLYGPEGMTYPGYRLFPGTDDEVGIAIDSSGWLAEFTNPGGGWRSAEHGVRIGTSLAQLQRLNGGPFSFSGFGWDYGGNVTDWRGGALAGHSVRLGYQYGFADHEDQELMNKIMGDQTVNSDEPALAELGVAVDRIYVSAER